MPCDWPTVHPIIEREVEELGHPHGQNTVYGKCELPGDENSIVFILPEGTFVSKGDVIVSLESAKMDQQIYLVLADQRAKTWPVKPVVQRVVSNQDIALFYLKVILESDSNLVN